MGDPQFANSGDTILYRLLKELSDSGGEKGIPASVSESLAAMILNFSTVFEFYVNYSYPYSRWIDCGTNYLSTVLYVTLYVFTHPLCL